MNQFRKFLDLNPDLRLIIKDSMKPTLWTIEGSIPGPGPAFACIAPTRPPKKLAKTPSMRSKVYNANQLQNMEGELMKIGRRTEKFITRYFELKDSALIIYKDSHALEPQGKLSSIA